MEYGDNMQYFFLITGVIFTIVFLVFRKAEVPLSVAFVKSAASISFVFTALFSFIENESCPPYLGAFIVCGACFGMLGDIFLDLKYVHPNEQNKYLLSGFVTFAIGHLFYSFSLASTYGVEPLNIIFGLVGAVLIGATVPFTAKTTPVDYGKFFKVTTAYIAIIGFTIGLSISFAVTDFCLHTLVFSIAMIFFLVSDTFLSWIYFGKDEKMRTHRLSIVLNHATYYIAQFIIAFSLNLFGV